MEISPKEEVTEDGTSLRVRDAIDSMTAALRQNEPERCEACFAKLSEALTAIERQPQDEEWYLTQWSNFMRMQRMKHKCMHCRPPAWSFNLPDE